MRCDKCGKNFPGSLMDVTLKGNQKAFCADCYGSIKEEYRKKKNCEDCPHFDDASCRLTKNKLESVSIGFHEFFIQAEKCADYTNEKIEAEKHLMESEERAFAKTIEDFEKAGRYEEAAQEFKERGMLEKAGQLRRKGKEMTVIHADVNTLIRQLADRGQTLTYHCCHCGAPLRIGSEKSEAPESCPNCGCSLEVIDLAKLIKQHL